MDLRQLRSLVVLAEERHFTRAAARLHVAQPALSQQIRRLEDEVGLALVDRTTRRVALTDAGEVLVERAQRALAEGYALPDEWRAVTGVNQMRLYLTPDELKALNDEIVDLLLHKYADRRTVSPDQPEAAERVEILSLSYRVP